MKRPWFAIGFLQVLLDILIYSLIKFRKRSIAKSNLLLDNLGM